MGIGNNSESSLPRMCEQILSNGVSHSALSFIDWAFELRDRRIHNEWAVRYIYPRNQFEWLIKIMGVIQRKKQKTNIGNEGNMKKAYIGSEEGPFKRWYYKYN